MELFFDRFFRTYPVRSARMLEVVPPLVSVFLISAPFWGAVFFPTTLTYLIIFFDFYWLYKSLNLALTSYLASRKIHEAEQTDWVGKSQKLAHFKDVHHLLIIPNYKENAEKLRVTLDALKKQSLSLKKLHICFAMEQREKEAPARAKIIEKEYRDEFGSLIFTYHPQLAGEVAGKSSNEAYAVRQAYDYLVEKKRLNLDYITVSSVDADSIFDPQFFANLTYAFLTSTQPYLTFWQSANVNYNNFWQVPAFTRVISFFGSLYRTSLLVQRLRLIPNSTYSLSLKLLKSIGYWDTDVIPEDYRIFFKAFFNTKGAVSVDPIYLKTSMDSAHSQTYFKSLTNRYNQERRWAWGISDDAIYLKWWLSVKDVPFFRKTYLVANVVIDHILWPVNWYIITISANLIVLLNPIFTRTSLGYMLPQLSGFILTLCLFALFIMIYVDFNLRSSLPGSKPSRMRQFIFPLEFILMPVAGFFLSSLPALISHIQLIAGKKMEYKVTEKV